MKRTLISCLVSGLLSAAISTPSFASVKGGEVGNPVGDKGVNFYYHCTANSNNHVNLDIAIKGFYFAEASGVAADKAEIEYDRDIAYIVDRASDLVIIAFPKSVIDNGPRTFTGTLDDRSQMNCTRYM